MRRLHAVIGEHEDRWLLVPEPLRLLDDAATRGVDGLVNVDELFPRLVGSMRRVRGVEPVPHEVPRDVRAHEVDAQETEVRLELEGENADVRNLVHVSHEGCGSGREVLEVGGMARHSQVGVGSENRVPGTCRDDLRASRPSEPGDDDAAERFGRVGEGHGHEGRAYARRPQVAPERGTGSAGRVLEASAAPIGIRREGEDAMSAGVEPGEERRPCRRRERRDGRPERSERSLARQPGQRREPSLREQLADEVVVGPVEAEAKDPHRFDTLLPFGV